MKPIWLWHSQPQDSYQIHSHIITPIVRSAGVHWHNDSALTGWLWQFPEAIDIEDTATGTHKRLPVPDPTRMIIWFLVALALVTVIATTVAQRHHSLRAMR